MSFWDPVNGWTHRPISEYEHVLAKTFKTSPSEVDVRRALDDIRMAVSEADGHAELRSHALMDDDTWNRFTSPNGGSPAVIHGTGIDAVIHFHQSLEAAAAAGIAAGVTFVEEATHPPSPGQGS